MQWRRVGAGIAAAGALGTGGTAAVDAQINPYEVSAEKYELASLSTIEAAGENKVEAHRDRPAVTLSKWNGEAAMTVAYRAINAEGSRQFLTDRIEWRADTEEVHAYPLSAGEGMEDGGFEIEIVLHERPASNVFDFQIEGADELDFFYQPPLTDEEIAEGAVRPENVIGSYAVYHETKANHRVGDTNYATGKAYHIYRPKAFAADGAETWAELAYADGVLSVTVPQEWIEKAAYPIVVDPTFGFSSAGDSTNSLSNDNPIWSCFAAPEDGTVTDLSAINGTDVNDDGPLSFALYSAVASGSGPNTRLATASEITSPSPGVANTAAIVSGDGSVVASTSYCLVAWGEENATRFDSSGTPANRWAAAEVDYVSPTPSWSATLTDANATALQEKISVYATYTASGGGGAPAAPGDVTIFE